MRSLIKIIDNPSDQEILEINIPTATPLVYEFDENGKPIKHFYLADCEELQRKIDFVKNQPFRK